MSRFLNPDNVSDIPAPHREFLNFSALKLKDDERLLGVAIGGSFIEGKLDEYSDLDLIIIVSPDRYHEVLKERTEIVSRIGLILESFTGEHVGEPRLLVTLYGPPLLHVDFKFVSLDNAKERVEDPVIIWERDLILTDSIFKGPAQYPFPGLEWIEQRFWIWIHYTASKIGRGELFEAIEAISFLRSHVLGPMILLKEGARPQGVRRIEEFGAEYVEKLKGSVPAYNSRECLGSLHVTIDLYRELRKLLSPDENQNNTIESEVLHYLEEIEERIT